MTYRFLSTALAEMTDAAQFYDDQVPGLGADFLAAVDEATDLIVRFPAAWSQLSAEFRFRNLRRFPYSVIYTLEPGGSILIVSVFHQHREPLSWRSNL